MKMLLYCTKAKPQMYRIWNGVYELVTDCETQSHCNFYGSLNGKIVGECEFVVEEIRNTKHDGKTWYYLTKYPTNPYMKWTCLTEKQLDDYLDGEIGYAIHIKNLVIYDEPRELNELGVKGEKVGDTQYFKVCEKAPQNMMYVLDGVEKKILISIQPQWLCKILNGEKTIEVRKVILKEMV